ncbi:hypothetical protein OAN95_01985 [Alphaproteobacteria bacterium]|nr:hypothetical protein [Alphaproteobacteria bacterium]
MSNRDNKDTLLLISRPYQGKDDGPHQIIHNLFNSGPITRTHIFYGGEILEPTEYQKVFAPKLQNLFSVYHQLAKEMMALHKNYKTIIVFGSFNVVFVLFSLLFSFKKKVLIIGYDSLTRTALLNFKHSNAKESVRWACSLLKGYLIESIISALPVQTLFVSEGCLNFHRRLFRYLKPDAAAFACKPMDKPHAPKKVFSNKVVILGPCKTGLDYKNFRETINELANNGFTEENIILFGSGFVNVCCKAYTHISYVKNFEEWAINIEHPIISMRPRAPGIQTKIQRLILFGNSIFCIAPFDIYPLDSHLIRPVSDLRPDSEYQATVKDASNLKIKSTPSLERLRDA